MKRIFVSVLLISILVVTALASVQTCQAQAKPGTLVWWGGMKGIAATFVADGNTIDETIKKHIEVNPVCKGIDVGLGATPTGPTLILLGCMEWMTTGLDTKEPAPYHEFWIGTLHYPHGEVFLPIYFSDNPEMRAACESVGWRSFPAEFKFVDKYPTYEVTLKDENGDLICTMTFKATEELSSFPSMIYPSIGVVSRKIVPVTYYETSLWYAPAETSITITPGTKLYDYFGEEHPIPQEGTAMIKAAGMDLLYFPTIIPSKLPEKAMAMLPGPTTEIHTTLTAGESTQLQIQVVSEKQVDYIDIAPTANADLLNMIVFIRTSNEATDELSSPTSLRLSDVAPGSYDLGVVATIPKDAKLGDYIIPIQLKNSLGETTKCNIRVTVATPEEAAAAKEVASLKESIASLESTVAGLTATVSGLESTLATVSTVGIVATVMALVALGLVFALRPRKPEITELPVQRTYEETLAERYYPRVFREQLKWIIVWVVLTVAVISASAILLGG